MVTRRRQATPQPPDFFASSPSGGAPPYLERVYAGVLGKIIGVYLGRPFEGWKHQRILQRLGHIRYYVNDRLGVPLVVTDDDVSGTFVFPRALLEHDCGTDITSEAIGKTWLNNIVEELSIFWWGGRGVSTEHTAYLNLKAGIKAPHSGSIETNGKTVAEQIGAQIFIDGWALIAPGNPILAAQLAEKAGKVSHDGESVYAAQLWAAMEAEAFVSKDVNHLLDVGLSFIPGDSLLARVIADVRGWVAEDKDWLQTRQRIEDTYGYDKFGGNCHVIPNHAIMVMTVLYAGDSFHEAMHIVSTSGWDTDCNCGNVGCLLAIMHGLEGFENGPDWREPIADQALISSADGGYAINNAANIACDLVNMGRRLAGEGPLVPFKDGAQFHFCLPGSVQGFKAFGDNYLPRRVILSQGVNQETGSPGLLIPLDQIDMAVWPYGMDVSTPTFTPPNIEQMRHQYELTAAPLVYSGQIVQALVHLSRDTTGDIAVNLRIKAYTRDDTLQARDGPNVTLRAGEQSLLEWRIPDDMDGMPIQQVGIAVSPTSESVSGRLWLDHLKWDGTPCLTLRRPINATWTDNKFFHDSFVNAASRFHKTRLSLHQSFIVAQDHGEGTVHYGTRQWTDYRVTFRDFTIHTGGLSGVIVRVQGLRRWYALVFQSGGRLAFVRAVDDARDELASTSFEWTLEQAYQIVIDVQGSTFKALVNGRTMLEVVDGRYGNGGIGFVVNTSSASCKEISIGSVEE